MTAQNAIDWPEKYLPGTGDNFVSNEMIVKGLTAAQFSFGTFGFPPLAAHVVEFEAPGDGVPGRLSGTAKQDGTPQERPNPMLNGHQAWLDGLIGAASK
ncbi:hypothetical protein ACWD4O_10750 [Streptomyces sp. NPDC002623]